MSTLAELTDAELRENHEFVVRFEALRKRFGLYELHDIALREIAREIGVDEQDLRIARALRNAIAHADPVNRDQLARVAAVLRGDREVGPGDTAEPVEMPPQPGRAIRIHAWRDSRLEQEMLANGFVSIGGDELGDLTGLDLEEIRERLTEVMDRSPTAINIFVGYWRRFLSETQVGDLVVLPTQDHDVAIGQFVGGYHYAADEEAHARHRRAVDWLASGVPREAFPEDLRRVLSGRHTVQDFKPPDAPERILGLVGR